ncbi:MAG: hypothetical protein M1839_003439 [Geoglossum umbratile]|nr:MAG: hypothetical protein M1839_003439 [Geoglossum umbratile]
MSPPASSPSPPPPPLVLRPLLPSEFLDYVLAAPTETVLIVCSARETFLYDLLACVAIDELTAKHPLLAPTLRLVAAARAVRLAFAPTLHHLRAYLSTFHAKPLHVAAISEFPTLALLNPIALHRTLPEYSAQGLSRTFAAAVEAAARSHMRLVVAECTVPDSAQEDGGWGTSVWDEQVPLLSGTARGFGGGEKEWTGRTVEIKRVLERWCIFSEDGQDTAMT